MVRCEMASVLALLVEGLTSRLYYCGLWSRVKDAAATFLAVQMAALAAGGAALDSFVALG